MSAMNALLVRLWPFALLSFPLLAVASHPSLSALPPLNQLTVGSSYVFPGSRRLGGIM